MTRGRGRLNSIELLPPEASDIVVWAARELAARERTLTDIYHEFRNKLIALQGEQGLAFDVPAFSSFHRHSVRQATLARRLEETRAVSSSLAARLDGVENEDLTIMVVESLKTLVFEILQDRGEAGMKPKEAMELARAMQTLVATSKLSLGQRAAFEAALEARTDEALEKVTAVAGEAGISKERIAQIRREFLGVRPKVIERKPEAAPDYRVPDFPAPAPIDGQAESEGGDAHPR